jgi:two-component system, cell cycle sensor histidine kinase and response regulator CckA
MYPRIERCPTILLVDDEPTLRRIVRLVLEKAGFRVIDAPDGAEALLRFDECAAEIELVVTDLSMPGMSGRELAHRLKARAPALKVLLMSGDPDGAESESEHWIQKPFELSELADKVRRLLGHPSVEVDA